MSACQTHLLKMVLLLLQGLPSIRRNKLPLAKYRPITGRLSCSNVAAVPDKTVLDLKYPIHLGTLRMPLSVCWCHLLCSQSVVQSPDSPSRVLLHIKRIVIHRACIVLVILPILWSAHCPSCGRRIAHSVVGTLSYISTASLLCALIYPGMFRLPSPSPTPACFMRS